MIGDRPEALRGSAIRDTASRPKRTRASRRGTREHQSPRARWLRTGVRPRVTSRPGSLIPEDPLLAESTSSRWMGQPSDRVMGSDQWFWGGVVVASTWDTEFHE